MNKKKKVDRWRRKEGEGQKGRWKEVERGVRW